MSAFSDKVDEMASLVKAKNIAYGNSFGTAGEALKILYPDGIKTDQYPDALLVARIWDKLKRIATDNDPFGESPFVDVAGYAICGATLKIECKGIAEAISGPIHNSVPYAKTAEERLYGIYER
jgi:hypothetical protein